MMRKLIGKFEIYKDKAGEYRWRLYASNGRLIAASEGYTTLEACENGISSLRWNAPLARIEYDRHIQ